MGQDLGMGEMGERGGEGGIRRVRVLHIDVD